MIRLQYLWLVVPALLTIETALWAKLIDARANRLTQLVERRGQLIGLSKNARRIVIMAVFLTAAGLLLGAAVTAALLKGGPVPVVYTYAIWALCALQLSHIEFYKITAQSLGIPFRSWPPLTKVVLKVILG